MKAYFTTEQMSEDTLLDAITLCNLISARASNSERGELVLKEGEELNVTFNSYVEIILCYNFMHKEDIGHRAEYIEQEKNNLCEKFEISDTDFETIKTTNKEYIEIYWNDLKKLKAYDIISHMMKNTITRNHENVLANFIQERIQTIMESGITDVADLSTHTIAMEDTSMMTLSAVLLEIQQKHELIDFYKSENMIKDRIANYEEHLNQLLKSQQ